jgi:hypothetical protein
MTNDRLPVLASQHGALRLLTLNRADKLNAFTPDMLAALEAEIADALADDATRVIALTGSGAKAFAAGNDIGPAPTESAFVQHLGQMGPRTASAVRDLSKTLDRAGFDIEIDWQQPARTTRRVKVSAAAAAHIAATVENANLDEQPVQITGEYLTVSAVSSWLIQQDDGDTVTVKLGEINKDDTRGLAVGDRVRIDALMKVETTPGGAVKTTYTAHAVHRQREQ